MGHDPCFGLSALVKVEGFKLAIRKKDNALLVLSIQALRQCNFIIGKWRKFCKKDKHVEAPSRKCIGHPPNIFHVIGIDLTALVFALAQNNLSPIWRPTRDNAQKVNLAGRQVDA